jgi:pectin methylesterase-like acyl-CoA thioesterase
MEFIQGDGTAYFDNCEIHSAEHAGGGFITAQGKHYATQESVFVFRNCRLTADAGVTNVVLGKPWRDYASVVFLNPVLGSQISPAGWREWTPGSTHRLETAFFRVYKPTGPGAATASLTLTPQEVGRYTPAAVLSGRDGWNPAGTK